MEGQYDDCSVGGVSRGGTSYRDGTATRVYGDDGKELGRLRAESSGDTDISRSHRGPRVPAR
jgi:hypothetical protein